MCFVTGYWFPPSLILGEYFKPFYLELECNKKQVKVQSDFVVQNPITYSLLRNFFPIDYEILELKSGAIHIVIIVCLKR